MKSCVSLQRAVAVVVPLCRFVRLLSSEGVDQTPLTLCLDVRKVGKRIRHRRFEVVL
jgi:hypothetical protein